MEHGQLADAVAHLTTYLAKKPNSLDAWVMLRQIYTRQNDTKAYLDRDGQDLCAESEGA